METDLRDFDLKGNWSNENLINEYFDLKIILDQIPLFTKEVWNLVQHLKKKILENK